MYRDDYLVEDLYEDWTMIERERLTSGYVNMLERLSDYYLDDGQLQKSIGVCYQILEKDPYHEESYRRLMRGYSRLGLRSRRLSSMSCADGCSTALRRGPGGRNAGS